MERPARIDGMRRLLIVEDEPIVARDLEGRLVRMGYEICALVSSGEEAIALAAQHQPDVAVMDIFLKGETDGIEAARVIGERHHIPVIFVTGYADDYTLQRAKLTDPLGYIVKPFLDRELHIVMELAFHRAAARREIREAQAALRASEHRLGTVIRTAADAIVIVDDDYNIDSYNPAAERLFGYDAEEAVGHHVSLIIPEAVNCSHDAYTTQYRGIGHAEARSRKREIDGQHKDGRRLTLELTVAAWEVNGQRYVTGAMRDISERKRWEDELCRRNSELAQLNSRLDQFAHIIGHDLRAPLRQVRFSAEWLLEDMGVQATEEIRSHARRIEDYAARMSVMLNELLAYAQVGPSNTEPEAVELKSLTKDILKTLGSPISVDLDVDCPLRMIHVGKAALDVVLRNLLENAMRYCDRDRIRISLSCRVEDGLIRFALSDDGPGIPRQFHDHIFRSFAKFEPAGRRKGGHGMGLPIVKRIVEDHGGSIRVESDPARRRGTTFHFTWMAEGARQPAEWDAPPMPRRAAAR